MPDDTNVILVCYLNLFKKSSPLRQVQLKIFCTLITARKRTLGQGYIFTGVCHAVNRGGLPQCMLGYPLPKIPPLPPPIRLPPRRPPKETPCQGDPLPRRPPPRRSPPRRPPSKETPLQGDPLLQGDHPPRYPPPGPHLGEIEGDQVQAHTKGEIEGDQIQAHTQGAN